MHLVDGQVQEVHYDEGEDNEVNRDLDKSQNCFDGCALNSIFVWLSI